MEKRLERMPAAAQTSIRHRSAGRRNDDRMSDARCSAVRHCKGRAPHHRISEHARLMQVADRSDSRRWTGLVFATVAVVVAFGS